MRLTIATVVLCAVAASAAAAEPRDLEARTDAPAIDFRDDGRIDVGGTLYDTVLDWQLSDRFRADGRRCATEKPTGDATRAPGDCSLTSTTISGQYDPDEVYEIPVVFHVIQRTDGTGALATSYLTSQLDILNEDFRAQAGTLGGGGYDTRIQFVLASEDPNGNATDGIDRVTSNAYFTDPGPGAANDMKSALGWDTTRYLNIYTNDANGALGYATFPQQDAGSYQDGVVLLWSSVGRNNPNGGIYDQGRTGTHEVGHYLGLFHTFQGGCGTASAPYTTGDLIADTNRQSAPNYNCPAGASSCSSLDPIDNYMNYTQDTCMDRFTAEQANRMRCALTSYRASLYTTSGGGGGGNELDNGVPVSGLSASSGGELRYTMQVPSGATNLSFQISGGSGDADLYVRFGSAPTTSSYDCRPYLNGNNETCSFASPSAGTWHVMLRAYSTFSGVSLVGSYTAGGSNSAPTAGFTWSASNLTASFTDGSTDPDGAIVSRAWTFGDGGTSTATNPSHTYATAGTYNVSLTVTDDDGATDSTSSSVTVTAPAGPTPLANGVPVAGLGAAQGQELDYRLDVPAGSSDLVFQISGGSGDADLYVRYGSQPTTATWDCRPYVGGNNETCSFAAPAAGTWYAMLRAYSTFSGVTLVGSYSTQAPNQSPNAAFTSSVSDLVASFTDQSSDPDGTIVSRSWNFGDGGTSTATNPSHTYAAAGTYTVSLTVTDDDGATDGASSSVTVTAPSGAPCTACDQYGGTLTSGQSAYQPNGTYYYSGNGVHQGWLEGAAGTDFDLYLQKWSGGWQTVASSTSASSSESISYSGTAGYYVWRVTSYSGSGSYTFWLDRP